MFFDTQEEQDRGQILNGGKEYPKLMFTRRRKTAVNGSRPVPQSRMIRVKLVNNTSMLKNKCSNRRSGELYLVLYWSTQVLVDTNATVLLTLHRTPIPMKLPVR